MDPGGRPDARHATGSTQSAVFCCPVMMVTKILVELWKKYCLPKKMHFWQNSGLLAQKSVFGTALMGMIFFHLTLLWYQNIKTSLCTLFKNVWVMPFFITFRSARKKLHVTVFFDHPVSNLVQKQSKFFFRIVHFSMKMGWGVQSIFYKVYSCEVYASSKLCEFIWDLELIFGNTFMAVF